MAENIKSKDGRREEFEKEKGGNAKELGQRPRWSWCRLQGKQEEDNSSDKDYIPEEKNGKYEFNTVEKMNNDMPDEYYHPRHGLRSVRTEL